MAARGFFEGAPQYRGYLARLYACHNRLFEALSGFPAAPGGLPRFSTGLAERMGWLASDLADLGAGLPTDFARDCRVPKITSRSSYLGMLYVLFGAALGARILAKQARHLLDGSGGVPGGGLTYLTRLAESADWPLFLATLEDEPQLCLATATGAAAATFACVLDHMTGSAPA